jgi:hypothetical protein
MVVTATAASGRRCRERDAAAMVVMATAATGPRAKTARGALLPWA